jgi:hypothetical protein
VKNVPVKNGLYAFTKYRRGDFVLFIEEEKNAYMFMQLPDRYKILLTKDEFVAGVKEKLLDFVEQIPEDVFLVCKANILHLQKA